MDKALLDTKGRIFNIQRFSIHDGPGIRTIVFLKGCPLRCRWCCNPESQEWHHETIVTGGVSKPVGRDVTVSEVLEEIQKDRVYYSRSGEGGITLSGGECLWQPDFSAALLEAAKELGISTAIETTGYAEIDVVRRLLKYTDTVLMDIKHTNGEKHKAFTTKDNDLILANARIIAREAKRLIIRTPVIPTFNDTEEEIRGYLDIFVRRFYSQQFKRSCMPDGPLVSPISLSPRGAWQMPSDISSTVWRKSVWSDK